MVLAFYHATRNAPLPPSAVFRSIAHEMAGSFTWIPPSHLVLKPSDHSWHRVWNLSPMEKRLQIDSFSFYLQYVGHVCYLFANLHASCANCRRYLSRKRIER